MDTSKISKAAFMEVFGAESADSAASRILAQADAQDMLPLRSFIGLLEQAGEAGELVVWRKGESLHQENLGPMGEALGRCATYGEALRMFVQGFPLVQSETEVSLRVEEDEVRFAYRVLDSRIWPRRADAELTLGLMVGIGALYGVPHEAIRECAFEHDKDGESHALTRHLGVIPRFGRDENSIVVSARALSARRLPPHSEFEAAAALGRSLDDALVERRRRTPLAHRVREEILKRIGRESVAQELIVRALGLSERSLRRALAAENSSFQTILDECRRAQGFALLVRSRKPMSEIAFLLGYSDQTAFSRALSRWLGVSPRDLRKMGAEAESVIR